MSKARCGPVGSSAREQMLTAEDVDCSLPTCGWRSLPAPPSGRGAGGRCYNSPRCTWSTRWPGYPHRAGSRRGYPDGIEIAGQLLVTAADNSQRMRSEASLAMLCGVAPLPASCGCLGGCIGNDHYGRSGQAGHSAQRVDHDWPP